MSAPDRATATASSGGIGFIGLLTIVLVVLKVTGYISISWWLVFLPVILSSMLVIAVLALFLILAIISTR